MTTMHTISTDNRFPTQAPKLSYLHNRMVLDATALAGAALVGTAWLSRPTKGLINTPNRPMGTYGPTHSDAKRKETR